MEDPKIERLKMEQWDEWHEWVKKIPSFELPRGYKFCPLPPFGGAMARFTVTKPSGKWASVYLDVYDRLGYFGSPYWEVYPVADDVERCAMEDTEQLVALIKQAG